MPTDAAVPAPGDLSCRELVELVTDYLEDALPVELRSRFETHLDACVGCRTYLDQMRRTLQLLGRLDERSIAPEQRERLLSAFRGWKRRSR